MGLNVSKGNRVICVYMIKSVFNNKKYIGSAISYNQRKRRHLSDLKLNRHHSILLQRHCNKYGISDLKFEIIEIVSNINNLINREQYHLDKVRPEFNILNSAYSPLGRKTSEKTKEKLREINIGKRLSDETREKMKGRIPWNKGVKRSKEVKLKISKSHKGKKRKPFSVETRRKMSLARKKVQIMDIITEDIYYGYKNVPNTGMKVSTLEAQLRGQNKNTTKYILLCR